MGPHKILMVDSGMEESQRPLYSSVRFRHGSDTSYEEKYGPEADDPPQSYYSHRRWNSLQEVEFRTELQDVEESGAYSPPLWKTGPSNNLEYNKSHHGILSPRSRTRAIIRGQQELMDMVKNMPESKYELTLRDLVEQPLVEGLEAQQKSESEERILISETENSYKMKDGIISSQKQMDQKALISKRSGKLDSGEFYIKMAFPSSLRSNTKKKKNSRHDQSSTNNTTSKVSPKPSPSNGSRKGVGAQFWNKSFSASGSSESGASTVNSRSTKSTGSSGSSNGSSRKSNNRHGLSGCWSCIQKNRSQVQNDS